MKKKKVLKLIRKEIKKASEKAAKKLFHMHEDAKGIDESKPDQEPKKTVLVVGECYKSDRTGVDNKPYIIGRFQSIENEETLCSRLNFTDIIRSQTQITPFKKSDHTESINFQPEHFTKLTEDEERDYLIDVAGHRGLNIGVDFKTTGGRKFTVMSYVYLSGNLLNSHAYGAFYHKESNTWAEPIEKEEGKAVDMTDEEEECLLQWCYNYIKKDKGPLTDERIRITEELKKVGCL